MRKTARADTPAVLPLRRNCHNAGIRLTPHENGVFDTLWREGASLDDIRKVLRRLAGVTDRFLRTRAVCHGLPFYRDNEGPPPPKDDIDEVYLKQLLRVRRD